MMPPAPTRIVVVPAATCPMTMEVAALAIAGHVVVLGKPIAAIAPRLRVTREVERVAQRMRRVAAFDNRRKIEDRQGITPQS